MNKRAILAGGKGTRLLPYTVSSPKPLVPIGDLPIVQIRHPIAAAGFENSITLAVNHQADLIRAYFGDGAKWRVHIDYSLKTMPLGTMGPLRIIEHLPENFLVMNGDVLTDLDFAGLLERSGFARARIVHDLRIPPRAGHRLRRPRGRRRESPGRFCREAAGSLSRSMGVYCLSKPVLQWIPEGRAYGFDQLMLALIAAGERVSVQPYDGFWLDIGRPTDYEAAVDRWDTMRERLLPA